jgi:tetratricopeptide (TPR) repeat protein
MYRGRFSALRRCHYSPGYWTGAASRWSSTGQAQQDNPPEPDTHPLEPRMPKIRSMLEDLINLRKSGQKLENTEEHQLYKLYRHFLKGGNCSQIEHSICHLYETIEDDDFKSMTKLTKRLESKQWYFLAYQVQHIVATSKEGTRAIRSFKRLSELAMKNRDFHKAERALEEAQSRIVEMLLDKAAVAENTDIDEALQAYEDALSVSSNIDKAEVSFKLSTLLLRRSDPKAASEKLVQALDSIKFATKEIIANKGMVPKYLLSKVDALPSWKQRIEERLADLQAQKATSH